MAIRLDHTVVFAKDHNKTAEEFSGVMDVPIGRISGKDHDFTMARVNSELSIYFMEREEISLEQHMAFNVDGKTFNKILKSLKKKDMAYGSSPYATENGRTDHDFAPRGLFWRNVDGSLFEVMTYET